MVIGVEPNENPTVGQLAQARCVIGLSRTDLDQSPITQFQRWFNEVIEAKLPEPNAMTLATCTPQGAPSARIVLLKAVSERGFVFFTNYESQKGHELTANPQAALVFFWPLLERQVRVAGSVSKLSAEESEGYFHSRPVESQIGAWASRQSEVLASRAELDGRMEELKLRYGGQIVPLPPFWGGYCVRPTAIEFWQARLSRLHDRFRYVRSWESHWTIERLSP